MCIRNEEIKLLEGIEDLAYFFMLSIFTATGSEQYGQLPNRTSNDL